MLELKMRPLDETQMRDPESLDHRIAALRSSLEREADSTDAGEPEWVHGPPRPSTQLLRHASLLMHAPAFEIRVYGFAVTVALVVGWLVASKL